VSRHVERVEIDAGFAGTVTSVLLGFLVLVVGSLVIAYAWGVADTKFATTEAARAAARTYVQASDQTSAWPDAVAAADRALSSLGRDPGAARVTLASGQFDRCGRISITVSYPAPLVAIPLVGRLGTSVTVRSTNSELVDPYRSGPPGTASCG
jgi:hypothetical protein